MRYNQLNVEAIQNHANLWKDSTLFGQIYEPNTPEKYRLQPHILQHPNVICLGAGMSGEVHRIFEEQVVKNHKSLTVGTDKDSSMLRNKLQKKFDQLIENNNKNGEITPSLLEADLKIAQTFELSFDIDLGLARKALNENFLINKQLPAIIGYYLNFWNEKGEVALLQDGFEEIGGKIAFQNILVLAKLVRDNSKLKELTDKIVSIDHYRQTIRNAATNFADLELYSNQIRDWDKGIDYNKSSYSPKDIRIIREQYQNSNHNKSYVKAIERDTKRILQII